MNTRQSEKIKTWLKRAVREAQSPDGPRYIPGKLGFSSSKLSMLQFAALAKLIGSRGMMELNEMLLEMAATHTVALQQSERRRSRTWP